MTLSDLVGPSAERDADCDAVLLVVGESECDAERGRPENVADTVAVKRRAVMEVLTDSVSGNESVDVTGGNFVAVGFRVADFVSVSSRLCVRECMDVPEGDGTFVYESD